LGKNSLCFNIIDHQKEKFEKNKNNGEHYISEELSVDDIYPTQILMDTAFDKYIQSNKDKYIDIEQQEKWDRRRAEVNQLRDRISHLAYGLVPEKQSFSTLLSHVFLHGGVMHLVGNMVFLFLFGFAVEGALGQLRFLCYYLVSGVAAGGFYSIFAKYVGGDTSVSLVGASGAISGVMAMYVGLYRLKKIEFFYWLFFVMGYIRAPAFLMLFVYVAWEIFQLMTVENSNTAYTAHIGGFLAGGILILLTQLFAKRVIDEDYLTETVTHTPFAIALDKIYKQIASFELEKAYHSTQKLIKAEGSNRELDDLSLRLLKGIDATSYNSCVLKSLKNDTVSGQIVSSQLDVVNKLDDDELDQLSSIQWANLTVAALSTENYSRAEKYFSRAIEKFDESDKDEIGGEEARMKLSIVSRRLSTSFKELNRSRQAEKYMNISQKYLNSM